MDGGPDILSEYRFEGNVPPPNDVNRCKLSLQHRDHDLHTDKGTTDYDKFFPFLGGWGDGQESAQKHGCGQGNITCINPTRVIDTSESENVLEVGTRYRELLGVASRGKDELIVVDKLFASLQYNLLSWNINGGDGLMGFPSFGH